MGMLFNHRRQSRDRVLIQRILEISFTYRKRTYRVLCVLFSCQGSPPAVGYYPVSVPVCPLRLSPLSLLCLRWLNNIPMPSSTHTITCILVPPHTFIFLHSFSISHSLTASMPWPMVWPKFRQARWPCSCSSFSTTFFFTRRER